MQHDRADPFLHSFGSLPGPPADDVADEAGRLALLHALQLLDSRSEAVFDRITRLASRLLNVPVTLFSLVDRDRVGARIGIAMHGAGDARTPGELLREEDSEMYLAKESGRGSIRPARE